MAEDRPRPEILWEKHTDEGALKDEERRGDVSIDDNVAINEVFVGDVKL
jgi:hypothetical protein